MSTRLVNVRTGQVTVSDDPAPSYMTAEEALDADRARAFLTRGEFLLAVVSAGIITAEVAEEAADGSWPAEFDTFLAGLSAEQRIIAKTTWADGGNVRRNNAILALIAAHKGVTDTQLDAMFGITA